MWGLVELVKLQRAPVVASARRRPLLLAERTAPAAASGHLGGDSGAVTSALAEGSRAEALYRESIDRLRRGEIGGYLARTHLVYGEWLRRERRRVDAREQLRSAYELCTEMRLDAFADRARREPPARPPRNAILTTRVELTAQEAQIARLARDGLSNPEIGSRLFISSWTVEYHLHKVFTKLAISSRTQLDAALPRETRRRSRSSVSNNGHWVRLSLVRRSCRSASGTSNTNRRWVKADSFEQTDDPGLLVTSQTRAHPEL